MVELSIAEAAERIGVTKVALRNKVARGTVAATKGVDGQWRVRVEERNGEWTAIPVAGSARSRRYTPLYDLDVQRDIPMALSSVDPVRRAEQLTVVQEILAPFIAELGSVREELGRERTLREHVEQERDDLRRRLDAPRAPAQAADGESSPQSTNAASEGAGEAERAPEKPQRWPWWMRILAGK